MSSKQFHCNVNVSQKEIQRTGEVGGGSNIVFLSLNLCGCGVCFRFNRFLLFYSRLSWYYYSFMMVFIFTLRRLLLLLFLFLLLMYSENVEEITWKILWHGTITCLKRKENLSHILLFLLLLLKTTVKLFRHDCFCC